MKWDSGLKPEVDNTYYIYQTGNDGLYHLALVEETPWKVRPVSRIARGRSWVCGLRFRNEVRGLGHRDKGLWRGANLSRHMD